MIKTKTRLFTSAILGISISLLLLFIGVKNSSSAYAVNLSADSQVMVGATYYGGEYNGQWVIDNANQCSRIANGEFTASSLNAVTDSNCDDDNGLSYQNDIPLHNLVSFAELSNNPGSSDYSALGGLASGTRLEIEYKGRCVVAEKRDVGQGGSAVNGYPRAIDLWWQTARSLGFTNGFDTVKVRLAGSSPLTPLGQSVGCQTSVPPATATIQPAQPPKTQLKSTTTPKQAQPLQNQPPVPTAQPQVTENPQEVSSIKGQSTNLSSTEDTLVSDSYNNDYTTGLLGGVVCLFAMLVVSFATFTKYKRVKGQKKSHHKISTRAKKHRGKNTPKVAFAGFRLHL